MGGSGGTTGVPCQGTHVTTMKRLVRLTENQLVNTYTTLFGAPATMTFVTGEVIPPPTQRAFPPLSEGGTPISPMLWSLTDRIGQKAMDYVGMNLATLTNCGAAPTDAACGQAAVLAFAQKAFRRPLTPEETTAIQTELWAETITDGASVADAIKYSYYGILSAPAFLYRTEMGGDWNVDGPLDQYEMASEISYFLTDGPPDDALLAAAAGGQLVVNGAPNEAEIEMHAARLLGTPGARANLEAAMLAYFQLPALPLLTVDPSIAPGIEVTSGLLSSMVHEAELFMANTLWAGPLNSLITSKRSWVNNQISMPIYGVTAASTDVNVFTEIMLPADRTGLLTLSPFLTSKTRTQGTSVVGRGLAVNAALVCSANPAFPETDPNVAAAIAMQEGWNEKEKADFRADPMRGSACFGCHAQFDAMGLVLENYDAVGRYRTMDLEGNVINADWTTSKLPESFDYDQTVPADGIPDSVVVNSPIQLAEQLIRTGALERCMAMNFINFALADESQGSARAAMPDHPTNTCAVTNVTEKFATTDKSFAALITEIASSNTLALRTRGM